MNMCKLPILAVLILAVSSVTIPVHAQDAMKKDAAQTRL